MMDNQKMTIGEIIELIQSTETAIFKLEGLGETTISTVELKPLIEAHEKQTPKKVTETYKISTNYERGTYAVCPNCGIGAIRNHDKHCWYCGQKLDWRNE